VSINNNATTAIVDGRLVRDVSERRGLISMSPSTHLAMTG